MKVVTVVGARPQFIKAATVSRALLSVGGIDEIVIHTGQHYDDNLSQIFFTELHLPQPHHNLGVGSGRHGVQTARMLEGIERVLIDERPDMVLVYGDTNSTLAGALAAAKLNIALGHVEAGLRSGNRRMPEEVNRIVTDRLSDYLFAPTRCAVDNLLREGTRPEAINLVGDVMYDAALFYARLAERTSRVVDDTGLTPGGYLLATVHRAENTDDGPRLAAIFQGLAMVARGIPVVVPLHPRTRKALKREHRLEAVCRTLKVLEPVGYLDMMALESNACAIVTDSGGVQKEAYFLGVPCVTLRTETEWVELIQSGWNRLAPPRNPEVVATAIKDTVVCRKELPAHRASFYGEGDAAEKIAGILSRCRLS